MAAMQSCFRNVFTKRSFRIVNKNGTLLQSTRGQHLLVFQTRASKTAQIHIRSKLLSRPRLDYAYRLASTNIMGTTSSDRPAEGTKSETAGSDAGRSDIVIDEASLPPVPSPSTADPDALEFVLTGLKEPPFETLGLGGWWPPGMVQQVLEYLHVNLELPWWGAICIVTCAFRVVLFPLAARVRRNAVKMSNNLPQLQRLQMKFTEARQSGNYYEAAACASELQAFMREKGLGPGTQFIPGLIQAPIFLSMYFGLKKMAGVPVESMKTGGLFWFEDLTVPDPYYILPLYLVVTLLTVIEFGGEGTSVRNLTNVYVKFGLRSIPFALLPFTIHFPGCILVYWSMSNTLTLSQMLLFKIPAVSRFFNIPKAIKHDTPPLKLKKGFREGFRESIENMKITKELEDRERINTTTFEKAGIGPVQRTFKTNPKKVIQAQKQQ